MGVRAFVPRQRQRPPRSPGHDVSLVADEGGLAAPLSSNRAALDVLLEAIEPERSSSQGPKRPIAVDVAATQLLVDDKYSLASENRSLRAEELVEEIAAWVDDYPIGFDRQDLSAKTTRPGWRDVTASAGGPDPGARRPSVRHLAGQQFSMPSA